MVEPLYLFRDVGLGGLLAILLAIVPGVEHSTIARSNILRRLRQAVDCSGPIEASAYMRVIALPFSILVASIVLWALRWPILSWLGVTKWPEFFSYFFGSVLLVENFLLLAMIPPTARRLRSIGLHPALTLVFPGTFGVDAIYYYPLVTACGLVLLAYLLLPRRPVLDLPTIATADS